MVPDDLGLALSASHGSSRMQVLTTTPSTSPQVGGNGGFSLRSRARTIACLDAFGYLRGQCEDVFYVEAMPKVCGRVADREAGARFSVESVYARDPFGFHAAYKWLSAEQMAELLEGIKREYGARLRGSVV